MKFKRRKDILFRKKIEKSVLRKTGMKALKLNTNGLHGVKVLSNYKINKSSRFFSNKENNRCIFTLRNRGVKSLFSTARTTLRNMLHSGDVYAFHKK